MPENVVLERERRVFPSIEPSRPSLFTGRLSWSALFAGLMTFLSLQLMFTLLGIGVGAASVDVFTSRNILAGLGIGGGIWFLGSGLVSLFIAGWVASRMAGSYYTFDSVIHGFLTWCLVTVVSVYLGAVVLGGLFSGIGSGLGGAMSAITQTPGGAGTVTDRVQDIFQGMGNVGPGQQQPAPPAAGGNVMPGQQQPTTQAAATGTAIGGIGTGIALLLGAIFSALGGFFGRSKRSLYAAFR